MHFCQQMAVNEARQTGVGKAPDIQIQVKRLTETAKFPVRGSRFAAGYDLYADLKEPVLIPPHKTLMISTGIAAAIPEGYFGAIFARSGLAAKQSLRPANCVGVVDSDYRGEWMVALHNDSDEPREVVPMERIAQCVIIPYLSVSFEEVSELSDTERSAGGFGSTGSM